MPLPAMWLPQAGYNDTCSVREPQHMFTKKYSPAFHCRQGARLASFAFLLPVFLIARAAGQNASPAARPPDAGLVLEGIVRGNQNHSYVKVPVFGARRN